MVKKCGVTFLIGFILVVVSIMGIAVLMGIGFLDEDDLSVKMPGSEIYAETTYPATAVAGENANDNSDYYYMEIPSEESAQVTSLDISMGLGNLYIGMGNVFSISGNNNDKNLFTYEITDGCFKLNCASDLKLFSLDFDNIDSPDLFITVPARSYDSVKINISAGELTADSIETNDLSFDISMGEATFYNVYAGNSAEISMSMGECNFNGATLNNAAIKMSAGEMVFDSLNLLGNNNIKLTAGDLYMGLNGRRSNYMLNIDKSAGEVIINGEDFSGTEMSGSEYTEVSGGINGTINIDLSAGDCTIDFYGNVYDDECDSEDSSDCLEHSQHDEN